MVGEVVGESIKSAIALKIRNGFAVTSGTPPVTTYPTIYKEQIVENMVKPSFFVWTMDAEQVWLMGSYYQRVYQMNIRYHTTDNDLKAYENLSAVGNTLLEVLRMIDVPIFLGRYDNLENPIEDKKPVYGKLMSYKITDGVLQLYVTYVIKTKHKSEEVPDMETLEINSSIVL